MPATFKLSVVAPDRTVFEDDVVSIIAPAQYGYVGIMANHEPMIVALKTGILEYVDVHDQRSHVWVGGGFLEVSENKVILLADEAERSTDIDVAHAQEALEEARKALRGEVSGVGPEEATTELERAMYRIKASKMG